MGDNFPEGGDFPRGKYPGEIFWGAILLGDNFPGVNFSGDNFPGVIFSGGIFPRTKANNPGRPVISSVNCHISRISNFVDYYLQPEVKKLKSYIKDTTDFIKKVEAIDHVSDDSYLVSLDIRLLYTNISHKEGIEALKQKLKKSKPSVNIKKLF